MPGLMKPESVAIIGGCGHVGLPLGLSFARKGLDVRLFDVNAEAVRTVRSGRMPFLEEGGEAILRETIGKNLSVSDDPAVLDDAESVVCVVGTPIDEHLNPQLGALIAAIDALLPHLDAAQLFVLRSTVYPGATEKVNAWLQKKLPGIDVAFCPERVAQGFAVREIASMPQLIAGTSERAHARAKALFDRICSETIDLAPIEAELGKLFCNSWRYITFAVANEFYAVCAENGLDYYRVWDAITRDYPRMKGLPTAGFAAGPCLFKDTMQLSAFFANDFSLGQSAMLVNEGLPRTLVRMLKKRFDLAGMTVGILGMAFKGGSDDTRDALSFKLRKLLRLECREVLATDSHVTAPDLLPLETVLSRADVLVIGSPHPEYRDLKPRQPVLDPWNLLGQGGLLT